MGEHNDRSEVGGGVGLVVGLMARTVVGVGLGLLLASKTGSELRGEGVVDRGHAGPRPEDQLTETELEREETIEALLHPDRSHHGELGQTEDMKARKPVGKASPREQGAAPIDITKVAD